MNKTLQQLIDVESKESRTCKDEGRSIKEKFEQHDKERYKGALVRGRAKELVAGETPAKRALGLEKAQGRRNHIDVIYCNGSLASDNETIGRAFFAHYESHFGFQKANVDGFKKGFLERVPRLRDDKREQLEGKITQGELEKAIDHLNLGKSAGLEV